MEELVAELEPEWGEGRIFRPYRDIRFSADKSPYKTNIAAMVGPGYVHLSADALGFRRMWSTTKLLLATGERQRWAYVTCFSICAPGQEDADFERMKQFIAASVPEFQLPPPPAAGTTAAARQ